MYVDSCVSLTVIKSLFNDRRLAYLCLLGAFEYADGGKFNLRANPQSESMWELIDAVTAHGLRDVIVYTRDVTCAVLKRILAQSTATLTHYTVKNPAYEKYEEVEEYLRGFTNLYKCL